MFSNRNTNSTWLMLALHRKSCAFASFRQTAARKIKALYDELDACKKELQLAQDEIASLKRYLKQQVPPKQSTSFMDLRTGANMDTAAPNIPLVTENARLREQIAQLRSENLRLQQELNRLNGGPSPFQCQTKGLYTAHLSDAHFIKG